MPCRPRGSGRDEFAPSSRPERGNRRGAMEVAFLERVRKAGRASLVDGAVATRLPAQDLDRARRFYAEKLGLQPAETRPGGLRYQCRSGGFSVFESAGQPS